MKPSCPTPTHLRFLQTSLLDQVKPPILSPLIFYYSKKHIPNTSVNETLERLKTSLPTTLSVFYPLAGRIQDVSHIACNDEGVPYVQVKVEQRLEDVLHQSQAISTQQIVTALRQRRVYEVDVSHPSQRFCVWWACPLGVKMNHALSDGFSMFMFVKTWASIASGKNPDTLPHSLISTYGSYFHHNHM
ncbi:Vinorine synthase [Bienertia sinuspersici]